MLTREDTQIRVLEVSSCNVHVATQRFPGRGGCKLPCGAVIVHSLDTSALGFSSERHCVSSQRLNGGFLDSSLAN